MLTLLKEISNQFITLKAFQMSKFFISFSEGNKKLKPSKDTKFLVWNLPSVITCPFATEHCVKSCYARKSERVYPNVLKSRTRNYNESLGDDFVIRATATIMAHMKRKGYKDAKQVVVRIHESGDFYSKDYAKKWLTVARTIEELGFTTVKFMAYTKSIEYFKGADIPSNMTIRFSLWDDTKADQIADALVMGLPIYSAVDKFTEDIKPINRCGCADCGKCSKCWNKSIDTLLCEIH